VAILDPASGPLANDPPYERVASRAARRMLEEHYELGSSLYKFWGSPVSVLRALALGWPRSGHPGHIHYAWDLERAASLDEGLCETVRRAVALLDVHRLAAPRLYEPGCGIAGAVTQVAGMLPAATLVGLSLLPGQLHIGRERIAALGLRNAQLCCGDYLSAPFAAQSFDGIYAIETLVHTPAGERARMFAEMFRVLRPGGRFVCFDGVRLRPPATAAERDCIQDVLDGWTISLPPSPAEFGAHAAAAGFKLLREENATEHIYASAKRIAAIAHAVLRPLSALSRLPLLAGVTAPLGFGSARHAKRFVAACRSQVRMFEFGLGGYYVHVMRKPAA
jgi:ubiquinone/menaquinone biosynthesis C-methylase UbiE